jgi:uncharacterized membrane protein HdeD (DUF308 family)
MKMSLLAKLSDEHLPHFQKSEKKFLWLGIFFIILGCVAVGTAVLTTLISIVLLGMIFAVGGILMLIDSFSFWHKKSGYFVHLLISLLYFGIGASLIIYPAAGSISLTLILGIFYIISGVFRISFASAVQTPHWGWAWFNGFISVLIGLLILTSWPASGLFVIGLFVGIDFIFAGWAYVMASLGARRSLKKSAK